MAVVADRWWQAKTALDALPATWDEGPNAKVSSASIAEFIKGGLPKQFRQLLLYRRAAKSENCAT